MIPYLAAPNTGLQAVAESVDLAAPPDKVWGSIGVGQLRTIERVDGKQIVERLDAMNSARRLDHLLRGIDKFLDLGDLRQHLAPYYSRAGGYVSPIYPAEIRRAKITILGLEGGAGKQ